MIMEDDEGSFSAEQPPQLQQGSASYYACPDWPQFRSCSRDSMCGEGEWCKWWACCDGKVPDGQFCLPWVGGRQCQSGHCKESTPESYWWSGHCKRRHHRQHDHDDDGVANES